MHMVNSNQSAKVGTARTLYLLRMARQVVMKRCRSALAAVSALKAGVPCKSVEGWRGYSMLHSFAMSWLGYSR